MNSRAFATIYKQTNLHLPLPVPLNPVHPTRARKQLKTNLSHGVQHGVMELNRDYPTVWDRTRKVYIKTLLKQARWKYFFFKYKAIRERLPPPLNNKIESEKILLAFACPGLP